MVILIILFERYFITYMLDCTLGVVLNCIFLTLFEKLFDKLGQRVNNINVNKSNSKVAITIELFILISPLIRSVARMLGKQKKLNQK